MVSELRWYTASISVFSWYHSHVLPGFECALGFEVLIALLLKLQVFW
jgi:hypothetical protein